jgi:poly(A) polymerase
MRPELLSELRSSDAQWILRTGRLLAEDAERSTQLVKTPAYLQLCALAQEQARELQSVSPDKLREQLEQILLLDAVPAGLQWLFDSGALSQLLPELHATVNFSQEAGRRHKDVWEHTKQVVWQSPPRAMVRWSALLHDIGKVKTREFTTDGKVTFHRHSEVGARMFDDIGRRFLFERGHHRSLRFLILHHLRPNAYLPSWTDSAVRRFAKEIGPYLPDLLDLSRADITSRRPGRRQQGLSNIDTLSQRVEQIRAEDAVIPPLPSGIGDAIMAKFRMPPSKLIGDLKRELLAKIEAGEIEPRMESEYYLPLVEQMLAARSSAPRLCCE